MDKIEITSSDFMNDEPIIRLTGQLIDEVYETIKKGFSQGIIQNSLCLFSNYFDIEISHRFEVAFDKKNLLNYIFIESKLLEVTQQFAISEPKIPKGWEKYNYCGS